MGLATAQAFYERELAGEAYSTATRPETHSFYPVVKEFLSRYRLGERRCLEIGCGRGAFQDLVADYVGVDLARSAGHYLHKPFFQASATELPFAENSFDGAWSYAVLEHVPAPERALSEMRRVLRPGGLLLLAPAWQCRSWAAEGYPVRPYSDFNWRGRLIKASIPIRESLLFRSATIFPRRIVRLIRYLRRREPQPFFYKPLQPNYERFWMSDSDAVNAMDPYAAILWFVSRGDVCLSYPGIAAQFFVRSGAIVFRIQKPEPHEHH